MHIFNTATIRNRAGLNMDETTSHVWSQNEQFRETSMAVANIYRLNQYNSIFVQTHNLLKTFWNSCYMCNNLACVVPVLIMFKLHLLYGLATSGSECATPLMTSGSRLWFALYVLRPAVTHIKLGRAHCAQQCKHSRTASHLHMNSCLAAHNRWAHWMRGAFVVTMWQMMLGALKGQFFPPGFKDFTLVEFCCFVCQDKVLLFWPSWNVWCWIGSNIHCYLHDKLINSNAFELPW